MALNPKLRAWLPVLIWAAFIFVMSTESFSAEHTGKIIVPAIHWLFPSLTARQLRLAHHYVRKAAHFAEYFVFALLLFRGVRGAGKGWRWTWGLAAFSATAVYAALDEVHQIFVTGREASFRDVLIDAAGALAAMVVLRLWMRRRGAGAGAAALS
ncbi:MAG TPA: VanZ family protein [Methylomirabilota bacterium]|nr:VanZ family protein [Methylomirabilota bacterium]